MEPQQMDNVYQRGPALAHPAQFGSVMQPATADSDSDGPQQFGKPDEIYLEPPKGQFLLGYVDVMCLVANRMIGSGIFNGPGQVITATQSTGASLLLWLAGIIYCLSGMHLYLEYGLNVPRYTIDGIEQSVPRSGGDLNYLQYVYRWPYLRENTVLLSACMFGIAFIILGNMAGNCLIFATRVFYAAGVENPSQGALRGVAIAIAFVTCFIHAFSRRGGILLNNLLAGIKVLLLLFIIITAIVVGAGGFPHTQRAIDDNTRPDEAFAGATTSATGYANAFLAIVFSFSGYEQPNYVLGEIARPRRKYPIAMVASVSGVAVLYMAVNISYMAVVPRQDQLNPACGDVAQRFFDLTLGSLRQAPKACSSDYRGHPAFNALLAISSLGNIIVMTYTAARVKQEIAKEGIIPFPRFFAQDRDVSLGRLLKWLQGRGHFSSLLRTRWLSPEQHTERTPVGALVLHLGACIILLFATWGQDATLLTNLFAYTGNAFFGAFLGLGILILRFRGPPVTPGEKETRGEATPPKTWTQMTGKHFRPALSVVCASIYTIGGLWPVVTKWIPYQTDQDKKWWLLPTIGWAVIVTGIAWFLGFLSVAWWTQRKYQKVFIVEKRPEFEMADSGGSADGKEANDNGGLVLVHETVYLSWVAQETLQDGRPAPAFNDDFDQQPLQPPVQIPPPMDQVYHDPFATQQYGMPQAQEVPGSGVAFTTGQSAYQQYEQPYQQPYQQQHQEQYGQHHQNYQEMHHEQQYQQEQHELPLQQENHHQQYPSQQHQHQQPPYGFGGGHDGWAPGANRQ